MPKIKIRGMRQRIEAAKETYFAELAETKEISWKINPGPQQMAAESEADELLFGGAAGGGKSQPCYGITWAFQNLSSFTVDKYQDILSLIPQEIRDMDSKALMWDGQWKNFSELQVGDRLMNPDGALQEVIQVHERGELPVYRLTFEDGATVECDRDHLWGFWEAGANSRRKTSGGVKAVLETSSPSNWNTNYIVRARTRDTNWLFDEISKGRRFIVPINAPLNYTNLHRGNAERAYLYGALIGDGSIQSYRFGQGIRLCTSDEHIKERCLSLLSEKAYISKGARNSWDIKIRDKWVDAWARNSGLLGKYSHDKFIPEGYLKESLEFRWNLVQGLFDTDGYASMAQKNEVSYCTVSPQLAEDVANLVRSLGYMAKIRQKQGVCYTEGYEGEKRMAYIVSVEGNDRWKLFSLPRKVEAARNHEPHIWVGKAIVSIEKLDSVYCRCITVSNPNGLYITDGYTVTHNSALLLILAATAHRRSIIFRRIYPSLKEMIEKSRELLSGIGRYNSTDKLWRGIPGDRLLEFGAMEREEDKEKFRGRAHDLKAYDELTEFSQSQYEFTSGWCRSTIEGQRTRVIATCNPPSNQEGQWIIRRWAPWLDKHHPDYPELPGVLRWYIRDKETNEDVEVPTGDLIEYKGELLQPKSRTFVPAKLDDNPFLKDSNYRSTLQNLPEPLRSQLLYGDFSVSEKDHLWQVIPTEWVKAAQKRWSDRPAARYERLGVDISRGGKDETIIAPRYDFWIGNLICHPGIDMKNGDIVAAQVIAVRNNPNCTVLIDVVAWGSSPYDSLKRQGVPVFPLNAGEASIDEDGERKTDLTGILGFANQRSEWWWRMREWLDPANGHFPELPPDDILLADLTTPRWSPVPISDPDSKVKGLVKVESKEEIKKRLNGRSTDRGDAVVMTLADPPVSASDPFEWVRNI